jgi:CRP/FNR family transcriptional regulator, putaive post-exponential-phase nitrogen-starvation regulator
MRKVIDDDRLEHYISKYKINEIFSSDMKKYMELFLFHKGEYICKSSERLEYLFFFVEGRAKVYSTLSNGKSLLLCFYKSFKVLGDVEFMYYETANSNVQSIEDTYCIGISFENIRKFALDDSRFLRYICDNLGEKLIRLSKYSSINLLYPLENRLASYILADTSNTMKEGKSLIVFEGNLSEVAELLGTSYRHLLRTLKDFSMQKLIKKNMQMYEILDLEKLKKLAGDLYE